MFIAPDSNYQNERKKELQKIVKTVPDVLDDLYTGLGVGEFEGQVHPYEMEVKNNRLFLKFNDQKFSVLVTKVK